MSDTTPAPQSEPVANENLLKTLVRGMVEDAIAGSSRTVFGEPVVHGDRTVVPVSRVSYRYGFGGGSGTGPQIGEDGHAPGGDGGGGAGTLNARPVGYIDTSSEGSRFVPVIDWSRLLNTLLTFAGIGLVVMLWGIARSWRASD